MLCTVFTIFLFICVTLWSKVMYRRIHLVAQVTQACRAVTLTHKHNKQYSFFDRERDRERVREGGRIKKQLWAGTIRRSWSSSSVWSSGQKQADQTDLGHIGEEMGLRPAFQQQ